MPLYQSDLKLSRNSLFTGIKSLLRVWSSDRALGIFRILTLYIIIIKVVKTQDL